MEPTIITINKKTFSLKFGLKVFRVLGEKWNINGLDGVMQRLAGSLSFADGVEITFDQIDVLSDLIIAAIQAEPLNAETISADEIDEMFLLDTKELLKVLEVVMAGFSASMPQPSNNEPQGKPIAAKAAKK